MSVPSVIFIGDLTIINCAASGSTYVWESFQKSLEGSKGLVRNCLTSTEAAQKRDQIVNKYAQQVNSK
jgi:hypothetical protein